MLACIQCENRGRRVPVIRRGDEAGVELFVFEKLAMIGEGLRAKYPLERFRDDRSQAAADRGVHAAQSLRGDIIDCRDREHGGGDEALVQRVSWLTNLLVKYLSCQFQQPKREQYTSFWPLPEFHQIIIHAFFLSVFLSHLTP